MKAEKSVNKIVGQPQTSQRDHPYLATKYYRRYMRMIKLTLELFIQFYLV